MPKLGELTYRDCPWCRAKLVSMSKKWSQTVASASGALRGWMVLICPRCAGAVLVEVQTVQGSLPVGSVLGDGLDVVEVRQVPINGEQRFTIKHLPDDVAGFFNDASVVLDAGVPDAAAVQLRRTIEAAAAHRGVKEGRLIDSIKKLIDQGAVTKEFEHVLHYVRKLGNIGAHYTDEKLSTEDIERALNFTAQLLRNLFEVPGELAQLANMGPVPTPDEG